MMRNIFFFLIFISFLGFISCNETLEPTNASCSGTGFYPLSIGYFIIYNVEEIEHSELGEDDTINYQVKEVLVDTFSDLANQQAYRVERFKRADETANWALDSIWTVRDEGQRLVKIENNTPFVKLVCPLAEELSWDGNMLNGLEEQAYVVQDLQQTFTTTNGLFDNSVTIVQKADTNSILNRDFRVEVFAKDVGLIYKKLEFFRYCDDSNDPCFGQDSVIGGRFYEQVLLETGHE